MSAPEPKSPLGYHRVLAPAADVKVSPLCLGAMNFGTAWYALKEIKDEANGELLTIA